MRYLYIILIVLCTFLLSAYNTPEPPKLMERSNQEYLKILYNKIQNIEVVNYPPKPNGNIQGKYGDMLLVASGSIYYFEVNVSSPNGKSWRGVQLSPIP